MGRMVATDNNYCRTCMYSSTESSNTSYVSCDYLVITGKRRGCKYGECDKYEPREQGFSNRKKFF